MYSKFLSLLAAVWMAVGLASCDGGKFEYHATHFKPTSAGLLTYADQIKDSVRVVSFDSWSLTNNCTWMKISSNGQYAPLEVSVPAVTEVSTRLDLELTPNLTGEARTDFIRVKSSFAKIGTVSKRITQLPYIHIIHPDASEVEQDGKTLYVFNKLISHNGKESGGTNPSVSFIVYSDEATLTADQEWISPVQTQGFKKDVKQSVELEVAPNTTGKERTARLTLSSNGVSTVITIKQGENPKQ